MIKHQHIVVEGPIGAGKTSLARRLAQSLGGTLQLEAPEDNPFLKRFYRSPKDAALPTQLFFLLQRVEQMRQLQQADMFSPLHIADYMIEKDRMFAEANLDDHELRLYRKVYDELCVDPPRPDLVVYLQAPADVLLQRVQKRGIQYEQAIDAYYLTRLNEIYTRFFHHYDQSPLLIVNVTEIDFVNNDNDFELLLDRIANITHGRHYLNPAALNF